MLSVTALGRLAGHPPVLRSGARVGDQIAVTGSLGRSGAGLQLLMDGTPQTDPDLVSHHRCPRPPHEQGPRAADAGATAMIDLSDGLVRDAGRIATASSVLLALDGSLLQRDIAALTDAVGAEVARTCVLTGGEEHSLLACFPPGSVLPVGWRRIGEVRPGSGVTVDGEALTHGGWDHFAG